MSILQTIHRVVANVNEADARSRLPPEAQGTGVYSMNSIWHYKSENTKGNRCETCEGYNEQDFFGNELRSVFPDHIVISSTQIYANVHMTLWGKETCYCYLWRDEFPSGIGLYNPATVFGEVTG
jgi:hypothetical protein